MVRSFLFLALVAFVSSPALSADPAVEKRLNRLERILDNQNLMQMLNSLQSLQQEVSEIRGEVELLNFELGKLKKQQKDIYLDLDQRIQQADQAIANIKIPVIPSGAALGDGFTSDGLDSGVEGEGSDVPETLGEQESYQAALSTLKSGRYDDAIQSYQMFLITYPESTYAPNAQYWMAEAYYVLKDYQSAIAQFQKVISAYPESRKVSDALLKIGFGYYELKEWANAQSALEKVIADFPGSTATRLAQRRLQKMKLEGNI